MCAGGPDLDRPSLHQIGLRQFENGRERFPGAAKPRARPRSSGLLFRWPLHGLHRSLSAQARHVLRIRLPALPLSRHGSRSKSVRLSQPLRFHPRQALPRENRQHPPWKFLQPEFRSLLPLLRSLALPPIAPPRRAFQLQVLHFPSARPPPAPG